MERSPSQDAAPKLYRPRRPERSPFYAVLNQFFDRFVRDYEQRFERHFGPLRNIVPKTVERFLGCGFPEGGFARVRCDACHAEFFVAFSCKQRGFCPSCSAKRATLWAEFVREEVIRPVPHRHVVFALPKVLRPAFRYRRRLLPKLSLCAWKALSTSLRADTGGDVLPTKIRRGASNLAKGSVPDHGEEWTSSGHRDYDYLEWIARLTSHIPEKGAQLVHYYGAYSNAHRGIAARREVFEIELTSAESTTGPPKSETAWLKERRKS